MAFVFREGGSRPYTTPNPAVTVTGGRRPPASTTVGGVGQSIDLRQSSAGGVSGDAFAQVPDVSDVFPGDLGGGNNRHPGNQPV